MVPLLAKYVPAQTAHIQQEELQTKKLDLLKDLIRDKKQRMALLFSGLIMMGHFMIIPFVNPFMEFNNGYSKEQTPLIYLVGGIAAFFAANTLGKLSDKHGKLKVFTICVLASLPLVVVITHLTPIAFSIVLVFFGFWFIASTGRGVTAQAMVSNVVEPRKRGSFMSFNSSVQQLGTSAASLIAGFIVVKGSKGEIYHYDWLGYLSAFILLICIVLGQRIFKKQDESLLSGKVQPARHAELVPE